MDFDSEELVCREAGTVAVVVCVAGSRFRSSSGVVLQAGS